MDKETLIKLTKPVAKELLAISVLTLPFTVKTSNSVYVQGGYLEVLGCK